MEKKKIVHILPALGVGGAETVVKDYACLLNKSKYEITIIVIGEESNSVIEKAINDSGIKVIFLNLNSKRDESFTQKVIRQIKRYCFVPFVLVKEKPDVIHGHLQVCRFIFPYLITHKTCKFIYTAHSEVMRLFSGNRERINERKALNILTKRKETVVIALHENMNASLSKLFHTNKVVTITNGIDFTRFNNNSITRELEREKLGIPKDAFVIGHVGRFSKEKNHSFILKIYLDLIQQNIDTILLLVGDGEEKNEFMDLINNAGLNKKCIVLGNRSDVNEILRAMDVFVFPSISEGLGIAVIEAQLAGIRCVVSTEVPKFTTVSNLVTRLSLEEPLKTWINVIENSSPLSIKYSNTLQDFNVSNTIAKLELLYDE